MVDYYHFYFYLNYFFSQTSVQEGVLLHGSVFSAVDNRWLGELKLALVYDQLRLNLANLAEISFFNISLSPDKLALKVSIKNINQIFL